MIRVMVVDDEILVRVGIKSLLNWEQHGYSIVCEVGSCREAIERIETHRPQIILTDLMMDGMDGFDLIEYCVREHPHIKLVVLSNYNDFEYVRRAMKMGAEDYIFKLTVKSDELLRILDELKSKIDVTPSEADSIIRRNLSAIKTRLITSGVQQSYASREEFLAEFDYLGLATDFTLPYAVLLIGIDGYEGERRRGDLKQIQMLKSSMENIIREVLGTRYRAEVYNYVAGELLTIIHPEGGALPSVLGEDFVMIAEYMRRYLGISVSGALSDVYTGLEVLPAAVSQASETLSKRFFSKKGRLYLPDGEAPLQAKAEFPRSEELADALSEGSFQKLEEYIRSLFDCLSTWTDTTAESIRMRILDVYGMLVRHAEKNGASVDDIQNESGFSLYDAILYYDFLESIRGNFLDFLPRYRAFCMENSARERPEIVQVKSYVRDHPDGNLDVEAAALLVGMSKSYFSHLFKKETGMSYVDYVNQTRISKAKELLQAGHMRVGEVADTVGIDNANYFGVLFKKLTGMTPGEYRAKSYNIDKK